MTNTCKQLLRKSFIDWCVLPVMPYCCSLRSRWLWATLSKAFTTSMTLISTWWLLPAGGSGVQVIGKVDQLGLARMTLFSTRILCSVICLLIWVVMICSIIFLYILGLNGCPFYGFQGWANPGIVSCLWHWRSDNTHQLCIRIALTYG